MGVIYDVDYLKEKLLKIKRDCDMCKHKSKDSSSFYPCLLSRDCDFEVSEEAIDNILQEVIDY